MVKIALAIMMGVSSGIMAVMALAKDRGGFTWHFFIFLLCFLCYCGSIAIYFGG